jgi:ABC transporter substrate binding protein
VSRPAAIGVGAAAHGGRDPLMDRRAFIVRLALGTFAVTPAASAQPARKISRIGIIGLRATSDLIGPQPRSPSLKALLQGLTELGYVYGEHFVTEARGSEGKPESFPRLAAELVRLQVDVIVAAGPALPALKQASSTIPIVMAASADPVGLGYVRSLGRPDGNITGLSLQSIETTGKRLELLKELVPSVRLVAIVWDQASLLYQRRLRPPRGSGGGSSCRWRFATLARSKGLSKQQLMLARVLFSCQRPRSSFRTPGESRNSPPRAGFQRCMNFGRLSRPAGSSAMARTSTTSGGARRPSSTRSSRAPNPPTSQSSSPRSSSS